MYTRRRWRVAEGSFTRWRLWRRESSALSVWLEPRVASVNNAPLRRRRSAGDQSGRSFQRKRPTQFEKKARLKTRWMTKRRWRFSRDQPHDFQTPRKNTAVADNIIITRKDIGGRSNKALKGSRGIVHLPATDQSIKRRLFAPWTGMQLLDELVAGWHESVSTGSRQLGKKQGSVDFLPKTTSDTSVFDVGQGNKW